MTPASRDVLLGFDARERGGGRDWTEDRRSGFLFRLDVARPVSIDQSVWRPVVEPYGSRYRFWEDLDELREAVRDVPERPWIVALGVSLASCSAGALASLEPCLPVDAGGRFREVDGSGWEWLGYDVADLGGAFSSLMNCGLQPGLDDVEALRAEWGPKLNDRHLFDRFEDAVAFQALSDRRVPEHAPFFVNGIWLVEGIEAR